MGSNFLNTEIYNNNLIMSCIVTLLGYITLIKLCWRYITGTITWILCTLFPIDLKAHGSWAVVTGATDGIGKAYCDELAKRGLNICLISRNDQKLMRVADEIKSNFNVKTSWIQFDFSKDNYADMKVKLDKQECMINNSIAILVNNVGTVNNVEPFEKFIVKKDTTLISQLESLEGSTRMNNFSPIGMTGLILPKLIEKNSGIIVHLSSVASIFPYGIYSATKVFNYYFADSLRKELKMSNKNIIVQTIKPGFVRTPLANKFLKPVSKELEDYGTWGVPSAKRFVKNAVNTIGWKSDTNGIYEHSLFDLLLRSMYENVPEQLIWLISKKQQRDLKKNMEKNK